MNFEDLKEEMDQAAQNEEGRLHEIDLSRGQNNPVQLIRSNMKKEIVVQLIAIVIFMAYPLILPLPELSKGIYFILMFLTSIMTLGYIVRLFYFLNKTTNLHQTTKDAVVEFIHETKLTLEVYKSFVTAGSVLLPVPVFALMAGFKMSGDQYLFEKWILLNVSGLEIFIAVILYLLAVVLFYWITVLWAKSLYGKYLKSLEQIVEELD